MMVLHHLYYVSDRTPRLVSYDSSKITLLLTTILQVANTNNTRELEVTKVKVKAAKTCFTESPGPKGHYLSAYLSVFKVYSHELMPGEIIAICKHKRNLSDSYLTFGPTDLTTQLRHLRTKG